MPNEFEDKYNKKTRKYSKKVLPGFKNVQVEQDGKARVVIDDDEMTKLMKKYKKLKKYQKSNLYQAAKLGGIDNELDRLLREYGEERRAEEQASD